MRPPIGKFWTESDKKSNEDKRFYAACCAMQGLLTTGTFNIYHEETKEQVAHKAFELADEFLKQENE
jgi:hypothetical protein